ncbi:DUF262 domain-containing protein [Aliivibrio fischeri]|uniref:DUF262 domain-containing protein n=1 Tax=Aliivibrio fischeri TaxID=668 RepID=UPI0009BC3175|nr:DUF262 domain-containing protein [Aliivibrio fischeri]
MNIQQGAINKSMDITVNSVTAAQLFSGDVINIDKEPQNVLKGRLNLPEYQRPYKWSLSDVEALLDDLKAYFSVNTERIDSQDKPVKPLLYLGSVVLHQVERGSETILNIIDGQQRITTLQLICMAIAAKSSNHYTLPNMRYGSPSSHERIAKNYQWLTAQLFPDELLTLDLSRINFTVVITQSEDEAYRFFETQNTGGVRLSGPQVIKAHHLRAIPSEIQNNFARKWESFNYLDGVVNRLLKARHWQAFVFKYVPSHRAPEGVKKAIVKEFAENVGSNKDDLAFNRGAQIKSLSGAISQQFVDGYLAKQPLNAGINTVNYLAYFNELYNTLMVDQSQPYLEPFYSFYNEVVLKANNSDFLTELLDITILLYVSEFGTEHLNEASFWLARCVFSIRLYNEKTVREDSISSFVNKYPLLDWITTAYDHKQLLVMLQSFERDISPDNIGISDRDGKVANGVKQKFLKGYANFFNIHIADHAGKQLAQSFDADLKQGIESKLAELKECNVQAFQECVV